MSQRPKAVLRLLLRAVDKHITSVAGNQQWRQHVLQQFRQARDVDSTQQQRLLLLAQEYADLVNNIAHHQHLLDTYNIGVDPDTRNKQMVEKTAARVGFKLPDAEHADLSASTQQQHEVTAQSPSQPPPTAQQQQQQQQHGQHGRQQQRESLNFVEKQQQQQQQFVSMQQRGQQPRMHHSTSSSCGSHAVGGSGTISNGGSSEHGSSSSTTTTIRPGESQGTHPRQQADASAEGHAAAAVATA